MAQIRRRPEERHDVDQRHQGPSWRTSVVSRWARRSWTKFLEDELRLRGEPLGAVVALEDREGIVDGCDVEFVDQGADASRSTSERAALAFIASM